MRLNLALLAILFCVIAFISCSIEKKRYSAGYYFSWDTNAPAGHSGIHKFKPKQTILPYTNNDSLELINIPLSESEISVNSETTRAKTDTIIPESQPGLDKLKDRKNKKVKRERESDISGRPIKRARTVGELKKAIRRDFKFVLVSLILGGICGGFLALLSNSISPSAGAVLFFSVGVIVAVIAFPFYFIRGMLRIFKLGILKMFKKSDDFELHKKRPNGINLESKHQYLRRFFLWFGNNLFSPIGRLKILGLLLLIAIPLLVIFNPH
jgi:hypothetical protein